MAGTIAPERPRAQSQSSLVAFADAFDQAQLTKDAAALERMVSNDLVFIDAAGVRKGKKDFIARWMTPGESYEPIQLIDRTVTPLGPDAAIVGAETTLKACRAASRFPATSVLPTRSSGPTDAGLPCIFKSRAYPEFAAKGGGALPLVRP